MSESGWGGGWINTGGFTAVTISIGSVIRFSIANPCLNRDALDRGLVAVEDPSAAARLAAATDDNVSIPTAWR